MKMSKTIEIGWSAPTCDNIDGPENFIKQVPMPKNLMLLKVQSKTVWRGQLMNCNSHKLELTQMGGNPVPYFLISMQVK